MYNTPGLIPAKFLTLIAHLTTAITLLWSCTESVRSCLPLTYTQNTFTTQHTQLTVGLSVVIGLIGFELIFFLAGITMFHSTSALLSIGCHSSACIFLCYLIFDGWQCGWFWWIFVFCSVLPVVSDVFIVFDVILHKKY